MPKNQRQKFYIILLAILLLTPGVLYAQDGVVLPLELQQKQTDSDQDGLLDFDEINYFKTNPNKADTDGDTYPDGVEIEHAYDPNKSFEDKLKKVIGVSLKEQSLTYSVGHYPIKTIKISSGLARTPTPKGDYGIIIKRPVVNYRGTDYFYPNTKWNLMFKHGTRGNYYIHGAYWHNDFGKPRSHGCINVSYGDMETLYNWAEEGTQVIIE
jgi:lipoprotein-anchoring transpeptidase ErfK/SrfK